jgi:hypothetical protein
MDTTRQGDVISRVGPVEIDWPRTLGYYGGVGLALSFGLIEPPLAVFIATIPFMRMIQQSRSPFPVRMLSQMLAGASKPVGGDEESSIRLTRQLSLGGDGNPLVQGAANEVRSIWADARRVAGKSV